MELAEAGRRQHWFCWNFVVPDHFRREKDLAHERTRGHGSYQGGT